MLIQYNKIKTKGFCEFSASPVDSGSIIPRITSLSYVDKLSPCEREIFDKIIQCYIKVENGEQLEKDDFILSGHEIEEFEKIRQQDVARYLIYRYKYNKYPELKVLDNFPPCIQIEPSSICNFRCIMCYQIDPFFHNKRSNNMGFMSIEMYRDIIDQIEGKIEAVSLASRGEPLLNKDIIKMIQYTSNKFLGFKINTNASLITEDFCHAILSNMDYGTVVFSVDSADEKSYEKIRKGGNFRKVVDKIKLFNQIKNKNYPSSKIITRVSGVKLNSSQKIVDMESFWLKYVDQTGFTKYTPWHSSYENEVHNITGPCTDLWRRMFIWYDGTVNPCDYDYKSTLSVGNIKNTTISNLWHSGPYEELRKKHLSKLRNAVSPCYQCPML